MPDRRMIPLVAAGAAVVVLAGLASFVGASLARPAPSAAPPSAPAEPDAAVLSRLQEIDRRLGYVEEQIRTLEQTANTALATARDAQDRLRQVPAAPAAPGPGTEPGTGQGGARRPGPDTTEEAPKPKTEEELREAQIRELQAIYTANREKFVPFRMKLLADATKEGRADRDAQAYAEARSLVQRFGLPGEKETALRQIYREEMERAATEIGPLVRDGIEKADVATVRSRLREVLSETDRRVRPLLDEEQWTAYQETIVAQRDAFDRALAAYEKK